MRVYSQVHPLFCGDSRRLAEDMPKATTGSGQETRSQQPGTGAPSSGAVCGDDSDPSAHVPLHSEGNTHGAGVTHVLFQFSISGATRPHPLCFPGQASKRASGRCPSQPSVRVRGDGDREGGRRGRAERATLPRDAASPLHRDNWQDVSSLCRFVTEVRRERRRGASCFSDAVAPRRPFRWRRFLSAVRAVRLAARPSELTPGRQSRAMQSPHSPRSRNSGPLSSR